MNTTPGIKCRNCGLRNYAHAYACKRCSASFNLYNDANVAPAPGPMVPPAVPEFTKATGREFLIYFAAAIFVFLGMAGFLFISDKARPKPPKGYSPTEATETVSSDTGYYLDYKYTLMKKAGDSRVVALFQPRMLPHDDAIFIGATRRVIKQAFGEDVTGSASLVGKEIKISDFYVLPIKEDTGEVHTLVIRR